MQGETKRRIEIIEPGKENKSFVLPTYGELKIICHNGKISFIEITTKEKID